MFCSHVQNGRSPNILLSFKFLLYKYSSFTLLYAFSTKVIALLIFCLFNFLNIS